MGIALAPESLRAMRERYFRNLLVALHARLVDYLASLNEGQLMWIRNAVAIVDPYSGRGVIAWVQNAMKRLAGLNRVEPSAL